MSGVVRIRHELERITLEVSFEFGTGLTALLGPSGAGKTRSLDAVAGLYRPDYAVVAIDRDVVCDTERALWVPPHERRIGYMFQDSSLFPHLTVQQNLKFGRWFQKSRNGSSDGVSLDEVVDLLGLRTLLNRHPGRLSGGERRRVALGRAILSRPRLLLLDEPLGSVDVTRRQEILPYLDRLISELRLPIIYVTHDWDEVLGRAEQVVRIEEGKTKTESVDRSGRSSQGGKRD